MPPIIQGFLGALMGMPVLVTVQMGLAAPSDFKPLGLMAAATSPDRLQDEPPADVAAVACLSLFLF